MQDVLGYSPLVAGIAFLPQTVMIVVGAQVAARTVSKIGPRPVLVAGGLLAAIGLAWYTQITPDGTYVGDLLFPGLLVTLGLGLCFMPVTLAATTGVDPRDAGLASGVVNTTRQIGGSIGLAALATLATARINALAAAGEAQKVAFTAGFSRAFAAGSVICLAAVAAAFLIPSVRPRRGGAVATAPARQREPVPEG
jgi:MFS family permease